MKLDDIQKFIKYWPYLAVVALGISLLLPGFFSSAFGFLGLSCAQGQYYNDAARVCQPLPPGVACGTFTVYDGTQCKPSNTLIAAVVLCIIIAAYFAFQNQKQVKWRTPEQVIWFWFKNSWGKKAVGWDYDKAMNHNMLIDKIERFQAFLFTGYLMGPGKITSILMSATDDLATPIRMSRDEIPLGYTDVQLLEKKHKNELDTILEGKKLEKTLVEKYESEVS